MAAVQAVLASGKVNYWTGEEGQRFEEAFAGATDRRYAVALMNGTVALDIALRALEIGPGDEVIVPSRTFVATASCVVLLGATPVFADVDPASQNVTAETIAEVLSPRTKAIIVVHLAGWPCDMDPILELARRHNLKVIEDCAQAQGARYRGRPVGSFGDVGAFSFCQDKIMTTGGEGGMLVMDDPLLWERSWSFKDHGKDYEEAFRQDHPPGYRWMHDTFGTNGRMTEMQAAIGLVALPKVPQWLSRRRANAEHLSARISRIPALRVPAPRSFEEHAYYKFYVFVRTERLRPEWDRDRIMVAIEEEGIPCFTGSCSEVYEEKSFQRAGLAPRRRLTTSRVLGQTSLMFLVHPTLSISDMSDIADVVEKVMAEASW